MVPVLLSGKEEILWLEATLMYSSQTCLCMSRQSRQELCDIGEICKVTICDKQECCNGDMT